MDNSNNPAAPKSPKSIIIKKTLILGSAILGLIAVGALVFVAAASSDDVDTEAITE